MSTAAEHTQAPPARYCTVAEAAGYLRVSERTIRRAIADGRLRVNRVGARLVLSYAVLDAFLEGTSAEAE